MEKVEDILAKYFSGNASPEEINFVAKWREENADEFDFLSRAWDETTDVIKSDTGTAIKEFKTFDEKAAWKKVDDQLNETKILSLNFYQKLVAACAILLVGVAGFWLFNSSNSYETIANNENAPKAVELPDGSKVWLTANTTLDYNKDFESNRSLKLNGEAFFEVMRDEEHPFIIDTEYGEIEVLGTAFNVDANSSSTVVSVDHGKVALRNDEDDEVQLEAGEMAFSTKIALSEVKTADENFQSWKTGVFNFDDTPLHQAIDLLNKFYSVKLELINVKQRNELFNGTYDNAPLDEIIEAIELTCKVEAVNGENIIQLK